MDLLEKIYHVRALSRQLDEARKNFADPEGLKKIISINKEISEFVDLVTLDNRYEWKDNEFKKKS